MAGKSRRPLTAGSLSLPRRGVTRRCVGRAPAPLKWLRKGCKPISVFALADGEDHLSQQPIPGTHPACAETGASRSVGSLFGLAPDGVFHAPALALGAVRSYRTFSPLPRRLPDVAVLVSVALSVDAPLGEPPACISG